MTVRCDFYIPSVFFANEQKNNKNNNNSNKNQSTIRSRFIKMMVNKIGRPNTTPTVRGICTFAVYFSVFRPFGRFTLVYEAHYVLCTLTKIHKPNPVGRPIISGCESPTERISSFVDYLLQPIAKVQQSYLLDTTDFINFIEKNKDRTKYSPSLHGLYLTIIP